MRDDPNGSGSIMPAGENTLLWLMDARSKAELNARCRATTITARDFATVIRACAHPECGLLHRPVFSHLVPEHLLLSDVEVADMSDIGGRRPNEIKGIRKIFAQFEEASRRAGHLFVDVTAPRWWLIYFSARDAEEVGNHWKEGAHPHVHLLCWLTHPSENGLDLWRRYCDDPRLKMPSGIHVRMEFAPPRAGRFGKEAL